MAESLVTIETYRFPQEAEFAKGFMEQEGIQAFLADGEMMRAEWLLGVALGYVKLQVAEADVPRALEVLEALRQRRKDREETEWYLDEDEDSPLKCLSCDSPMGDDDTHCAKCGWSYESTAEA